MGYEIQKSIQLVDGKGNVIADCESEAEAVKIREAVDRAELYKMATPAAVDQEEQTTAVERVLAAVRETGEDPTAGDVPVPAPELAAAKAIASMAPKQEAGVIVTDKPLHETNTDPDLAMPHDREQTEYNKALAESGLPNSTGKGEGHNGLVKAVQAYSEDAPT